MLGILTFSSLEEEEEAVRMLRRSVQRRKRKSGGCGILEVGAEKME